MALRKELQSVVEQLLHASEDTRVLSLDDMGAALGTIAASSEEIDAMLTQLETQGRTITGPRPGQAKQHLQRILPIAHTLKKTLGRAPSIEEIAEHTGLSPDAVRAALSLGKVMGR